MCEDKDNNIVALETILKDITVSDYNDQLVVSSKVKTVDEKWVELSVRVDPNAHHTFEAVVTKWDRNEENSNEQKTQLRKMLFSGIRSRKGEIMCPVSPP